MSRLLLSALLLAAACGQSETDSGPEPQAGGSAGSGGSPAGGKTSGAGKGGSAGSLGDGGAGDPGGGSPSSPSAGMPGSEGGASSGGEPSGSGGVPEELVDCDARKVVCKIAPPQCNETFSVPSVEGSCYGPCVPIERCACASAAECPDDLQFTCWSGMHCGPYVK